MTGWEATADQLYGLPLQDFVRERDGAVREARKAGERDDAARIGALTKPTVAAWAVNQLSRLHHDDVDRLLDAGERLRSAQEASLARGGRKDLDEARVAVNDAVSRLTMQAAEILGSRASEDTLSKVAETLRSAAISPEGRDLLVRGRFVKEATGTGWDVLTSLRPVTRRQSTASSASPEKKERSAPSDAARKAKRKAANRRDKIAQQLAEAQRYEAETTRASNAASKQVARLRDALERAEADLQRADAAIAGSRGPAGP